ncbi:hypothetical protein DVA67_017525 [Solirubrobacter sp. CPCC 204708]|nr:hypothetical protein [Solirubrobacter deserti]
MRRAIVLIACALSACLLPAKSGAQVYEVRACTSGATDTSWTSTSSTGTLSSASCPGAGFFAGDARGRGASSHGSAASWRVAAPPSTVIRRMTVSRHLSRWWDWRAEIVTDEGVVLDSCDVPWYLVSCERGAPAASGRANTAQFDDLRTRAVTFRVACGTSGGCTNGTNEHRALIAVYQATLQIEDPAPPSVSALSGSFSDAGWHRGTDSVSVSASDASGIRTMRLFAGNNELASKAGACDYTRMQPCQGSMNETFVLDTAKVPDGTHELKVVATDAADQPAATTGTIRVDRTAPVAPSGLSLTPDENGTYALAWTNGDQGTAAPVVAARYAICEEAPVQTCQAAQRVRTPVEKLSLPAGKYALRVWLEDEAGNADPSRHATVPVDTSVQRSPRVLDTNPPILLPSGPAPSSRLKVTKARRSGSTLTLSGTIARGASARITAGVARSRSGRILSSSRTTPRQGKWSIRLKLSPTLRAAGAMYLTLSYAGQADFRKTTLKRRLARSASRSSNTAVEFSIETGRR